MPKKNVIKVPRITWTLGDVEQATHGSCIDVLTRPLYYFPDGAERAIEIGRINPDYSQQLMEALNGGV